MYYDFKFQNISIKNENIYIKQNIFHIIKINSFFLLIYFIKNILLSFVFRNIG